MAEMISFNSLSGGQSSSYIAAHYPADFDVFALVTVSDPKLRPADDKLVQMVSDRIGREFIGTVEQPEILQTMFDLEQFTGRRIYWVAGQTFESVIENIGRGYLPNIMKRFCTSELKLRPMFEFWQSQIGEPVTTRIGFRLGEENRAQKMRERCNDDGLVSMKHIIGELADGRNKWATTPWQKPEFPLIRDGIRADTIRSFWTGKNVRFAERNNCVGCFHRNPLLLRKMAETNPTEFGWFVDQEQKHGGRWRSDVPYKKIRQHRLQSELSFDDFAECDSGHCGL